MQGKKAEENSDQDQQRAGKKQLRQRFFQKNHTEQRGGQRLQRIKGGAGASGQYGKTFVPEDVGDSRAADSHV